MSGWDVTAVAGGFAVVLSVTVMLVRLVVAVARLDRTTGALVRAIEEVRRDTMRPVSVPPGDSLAGAPGSVGVVGNGRSHGSGEAGGRAGRGRRANGDAEAHRATPMLGRIDLGPRLSDLGLVSPVIKARALGRGTSQAARQFRQRRER